MASFSTSHGTFSTNTRTKRVEKYLGASSCNVVVECTIMSVFFVSGSQFWQNGDDDDEDDDGDDDDDELASRCLFMILQR